MITVMQAVTDEQIGQVRELLAEYFEFLRTDVDKDQADLNDVPPLAGYQGEIAGLPGKYAPPEGRLLLALADGAPAGCVALYNLGEGVCEMKRLWARPQYRGMKIGRALVERLIEEAHSAGYASMVLSTVDVLKAAQSLYTTLGFQITEPYYDASDEFLAHEIFMKLELAQ